MEGLAEKTVLLVTHQVDFLPAFDFVLVIFYIYKALIMFFSFLFAFLFFLLLCNQMLQIFLCI